MQFVQSSNRYVCVVVTLVVVVPTVTKFELDLFNNSRCGFIAARSYKENLWFI